MLSQLKISKKTLQSNFKTILRINKIDYLMYFCVFLFTILPAIWNLLRTHIIANYIDFSVETYAQWTYLETLLEMLQEGMILPLFWWFGTSMKNKNEIMGKIKTAFILVAIIYTLSLILTSIFSNKFVLFLNNDSYVENLSFFVLQLWSKLPEVLLLICTTVLVLFQKYIYTLILAIVKISIGIFCDYIFSTNLVITPKLSLVGVSSLLANFIVFIIALVLVIKIFGFKIFFNNKNYVKPKNVLSTSLWSFLDSFVRNVFYLFVFAKLMNNIDGSQAYYIANAIIWNWMLIPLITLSDVHKSQTAKTLKNKSESIILFFQYQLISLFVFLLMMSIFLPLWKPMAFFMSNNQTTTLLSWKIAKIVIGFYILYATSATADSFFYGSGKTINLLIQSLIVNILVYVPVIIYWQIANKSLSLDAIVLIFGSTMALDSFIGYGLIFFTFLRWKEKATDKSLIVFKQSAKIN